MVGGGGGGGGKFVPPTMQLPSVVNLLPLSLVSLLILKRFFHHC